MKEKLTSAQKKVITNSKDVASIMQQILRRKGKAAWKTEHFWAVYLNSDNQIVSIELTALGTLNSVFVESLDVFGPALQQRCTRLIVVHNHPGCNATPSTADKLLTHKFYAIARFLNIKLLDHIIITDQGYYSFWDEGLMTKIEQEERFNLSLSNASTWLGIQRNMKRSHSIEKRLLKTTIAQRMLKKGKLEIQEIGEITGLTSRQLAKLQPCVGSSS